MEKRLETGDVSRTVPRYFDAYVSSDHKALEGLLSDDFTFTSPGDDHIDKATYFERCWPGNENVRAYNIESLFESGNEAVIRHECEWEGGDNFRCMEHFRIEDGKVREVDVFFEFTPIRPWRGAVGDLMAPTSGCGRGCSEREVD